MAEESLINADYWSSFWAQHAKSTISADLQCQVLRTLNKKPISEAQFQSILSDIERKTAISSNDEILDLCCGNGLITKRLASQCKRIVGVDVVPELVEQINAEALGNISLIVQDVRGIDFERSSFDKVIIYAGLQYFSYAETISLFESARRWLKSGGLFYAGDIPNRKKLWNFFDTDDRAKAYFDSIKNREPIIGTWFDPEWLTKLGQYCGFEEVAVLEQPCDLPYSHYRFDITLKR